MPYSFTQATGFSAAVGGCLWTQQQTNKNLYLVESGARVCETALISSQRIHVTWLSTRKKKKILSRFYGKYKTYLVCFIPQP